MSNQLEQLEQQKDHPQSIVMATGSSRRHAQMVKLLDQLKISKTIEHIKVHKISPEKEVAVDESNDSNPGLVSLEKVLAVAYALGVISEQEVGENLLRKWAEIQRVCPKEKEIEIDENIVFYGGDVITLVSITDDPDAYLELFKLTRSLTGDNEQDKIIIKEDRDKIVSIYINQEGFFVKYRVGMALMSNNQVGSSAAITMNCDIVMKLKGIPLEVVEEAYIEGGTAFQVGPRLDLATLAEDYLDEDFGIHISHNLEESQEIYPIELEIMKGFVLGGMCPPHAFFKLIESLLSEEHTNGKQITSRSIGLDLESMAL